MLHKLIYGFVIFYCKISFAQSCIIVKQEGLPKPLAIANFTFDSIIEKENTTKFYFKTKPEPDKTILIVDTSSFEIFPFWVEPDIKEITLHIDNIKMREIWLEKPSLLNKLDQISNLYTEYLERKSMFNANQSFDSIYPMYLKKIIRENTSNYYSLYNLSILVAREHPDTLLKLLPLLDSSLHQYTLYKQLMSNLQVKKTMETYKRGDKVTYYDI